MASQKIHNIVTMIFDYYQNKMEINYFLAKEEMDEKFINLNRLRVEGSIRQVDAPKQLTKPAIQGRTKSVSIS